MLWIYIVTLGRRWFCKLSLVLDFLRKLKTRPEFGSWLSRWNSNDHTKTEGHCLWTMFRMVFVSHCSIFLRLGAITQGTGKWPRFLNNISWSDNSEWQHVNAPLTTDIPWFHLAEVTSNGLRSNLWGPIKTSSYPGLSSEATDWNFKWVKSKKLQPHLRPCQNERKGNLWDRNENQ